MVQVLKKVVFFKQLPRVGVYTFKYLVSLEPSIKILRKFESEFEIIIFSWKALKFKVATYETMGPTQS